MDEESLIGEGECMDLAGWEMGESAQRFSSSYVELPAPRLLIAQNLLRHYSKHRIPWHWALVGQALILRSIRYLHYGTFQRPGRVILENLGAKSEILGRSGIAEEESSESQDSREFHGDLRGEQVSF